MRTFPLALISISCLVASPVLAQDTCDSVLRDGAFQRSELKNNYYASLSIAASLASMTYSEARSKTGAGVNIPIHGVPIGADYNEEDFNKWQQEVKQTLNVDAITHNQSSVFLSSGDSKILEAWSACKASLGGLTAYLKPADDQYVTLVVRFRPFPGGAGQKPKITSRTIEGAQILGGANLIEVGTALPGDADLSIPLRRKPNDAVYATINTEVGSKTAYLPAANLSLPPPRKLEICSCTGHGGVDGKKSWGPKGQTCWGIPPWGVYDQDCVTVTHVAKCTGKENVNGVTLWGPPGKDCAGISGWGTYTAASTPVSSRSMCWCTGHGDKIVGMQLWGPKEDWCGGFPTWGKYTTCP